MQLFTTIYINVEEMSQVFLYSIQDVSQLLLSNWRNTALNMTAILKKKH